jgi:hypothetical protein
MWRLRVSPRHATRRSLTFGRGVTPKRRHERSQARCDRRGERHPDDGLEPEWLADDHQCPRTEQGTAQRGKREPCGVGLSQAGDEEYDTDREERGSQPPTHVVTLALARLTVNR